MDRSLKLLDSGVAYQQEVAADGSTPPLRELYKSHFDTNLFGAVVAVDTFLPLLRKSKGPVGKRIAFTSSGLASLQWGQDGGPNGVYHADRWIIYRSTKTAMSMVVQHYAAVLEKEGFVVSSSDPGYCKFLEEAESSSWWRWLID
jgi:NAD(P)-dependent dehydrogenase (short-subunit alcohol dehydrogenase family)